MRSRWGCFLLSGFWDDKLIINCERKIDVCVEKFSFEVLILFCGIDYVGNELGYDNIDKIVE